MGFGQTDYYDLSRETVMRLWGDSNAIMEDDRLWKAVVDVSRSLQRVAINLLRVVEIIQLKHLFCYA